MDANVAHGFFISPDPVKAFTSDKLLWGSMAATENLERVVHAAIGKVDAWLKNRP